MTHRIGLGYDIHRTTPGRALMLANIPIPHTHGLEAHSDGDVVLHALIDAITGAANLPDVGQLFPNTDPQYKDINSAQLLEETMRLLRNTGYQIVNTDIIILAQSPKLSPHKPAMIKRLAQLLQISESQINIKGKTGESVDAIGEERAIACHCVILISR